MPAESKKQQRFFGMVHAVQKGDLSPSEVGPAVRKAARNTEYSDAKDIASTKHKNLPEKVGSMKSAYNLASKWKGTAKFKFKGDSDWRTVKVDSSMSAKDIEKLVKSTKSGRVKKGSLQMKYFEKIAKEDSGYTGAVIGGAAGAGLAGLRLKQVKEEIPKKLKQSYKARRASSKVKGAAKYNKALRSGLRGGAKAGIGLVAGGATAIGAGIGHLFD